MLLNRQKRSETIYDYKEPRPQVGRCTTFYYRNDTFSPAPKMEDERFADDPEAILILDKFKKTEKFGKSTIFEATPESLGSRIQFAIHIPLADRSFLILCDSVANFGIFMRNYWPLMPWVEHFLPKNVTQFVPSYTPIRPNSTF